MKRLRRCIERILVQRRSPLTPVAQSIIIGRSAKPKSVRESSLYDRHVLPVGTSRTHKHIRAWRRGFVRTLIIDSFAKRTLRCRPIGRIHAPTNALRGNLAAMVNCIQPCYCLTYEYVCMYVCVCIHIYTHGPKVTRSIRFALRRILPCRFIDFRYFSVSVYCC